MSLEKVLKSKYYPNIDFMQENLKKGAPYTWLSILSARKVLQERAFWGIGKGDKVSIFIHSWLPYLINYKLQSIILYPNIVRVADLINKDTREWRRDVITSMFAEEDADRILKIPLSTTS